MYRTGLLWLACALIAAVAAPAQVTETLVHSFSPPPRGANPYATPIRDSAGNLYGTTGAGGAENAGAVYKLTAAGQLNVLYSFTGGSDGSGPRSGVVRDSAGNFYGTTVYGGAYGAGVVYKLDTTRHLTVLYSFTGGSDGANPFSGVILDSAGNLYGTTAYGGSAYRNAGHGVVYELSSAGQLTVLYSFSGGTDGAYPYAGVIRDSAGNLYGTTYFGGAAGQGVVYNVATANSETVLYSFAGGADGANPNAGVVRDSAGNFYGTTIYGGTSRAGVVYQVTAAGAETVLYTFTGGTDGTGPYAGVIRDTVGNLYGTAAYGGAAGEGVAYKLDTTGVQTVLYGFPESGGGYGPNSGVILDGAGNLYGTTPQGGSLGAGVVYRMSAAGHEAVLYSFTGGADGSNPNSGVVRDSAGNLYGTTFNGGTFGYGTVYKLDTAGNETVLYTFTGGSDGSNPYAGVVRDSAGNLYGTTWYGGVGGAGVIYQVDASGNETVLYSFTGAPGNARSYSGLYRDSAGNLYGVSYSGGTAGFGAVYKLDTANNYTVLYNFTGGADGRYPYAGVIRDAAGNLYGTTEVGGAYYGGVVYKVDTSGNETVLYNFTGGSDGDYPNGGLIRDSAGNFYGTTTYGGASGFGAVYKLDTTNQLTVLYSFTGAPDGANPQAGVVRDSAGNLYGTTQYGGAGNVGALFKIASATAK